MVMKTFKSNAEKGKKVLLDVVPRLAKYNWVPIIEERVVSLWVYVVCLLVCRGNNCKSVGLCGLSSSL